jgi:hypothetical protein
VELRSGGSGTSLGTAILLSDPSDKPGEVRLILESDKFDPRRSIEMAQEVGNLLKPIDIVEKGDDYELTRYRDMRRSG